MGQYYLIVNCKKEQYLRPHVFGCGSKLMEFSTTANGPMAALAVLCASGNGRGGGGDLHASTIDDPRGLVGSWAGDPIVVAGDYADPWQHVPAKFKRRVIEQDYPAKLADNRWGSAARRLRFDKRVHVDINDPDNPRVVDADRTLYETAEHFFSDISDEIMRIVGTVEAANGHPWAAVDAANVYRDIRDWYELPDDTPVSPLCGKVAYEQFRAGARTSVELRLAGALEAVARQYRLAELTANPAARPNAAALLRVFADMLEVAADTPHGRISVGEVVRRLKEAAAPAAPVPRHDGRRLTLKKAT